MAAIQAGVVSGTDQRYRAAHYKIGISMLPLQRYLVAEKCNFCWIHVMLRRAAFSSTVWASELFQYENALAALCSSSLQENIHDFSYVHQGIFLALAAVRGRRCPWSQVCDRLNIIIFSILYADNREQSRPIRYGLPTAEEDHSIAVA